MLLLYSGCTLFESKSNIVLYSGVVIANASSSPDKSGITFNEDASFSYVNPFTEKADIVVSSFLQNSIVFISPSKDTTLFFTDNETGYQDVGAYMYDYSPESGYYDMEFLTSGHYYFIRTSSGRYVRLFLNSFSSDSILCDIEVTSDNSSVFN